MYKKVDMKRLCLVKDSAHNQDKWRSLTTENRPTPPQWSSEGVIPFRDCVLVTLNISDE